MTAIGVVGSRTFSNMKLLSKILDEEIENEENVIIVSGGAKGADTLAEIYAKNKGINTKIFIPNWSLYGKRAGFIRNKLIVENSDKIIAFWDGRSKGTKMTIDLAKKENKPVMVITACCKEGK